MKNLIKEFKETVRELVNENSSREEIRQLIETTSIEFKDVILKADSSLYSFDKKRSGYGQWMVELWVNRYYFTEELKMELEKGMKFRVTDEDYEPELNKYEEQIHEIVLEFLWNITEKIEEESILNGYVEYLITRNNGSVK